eukprot:Skav220974  [mRNA]  locus=scaffold3282:75130:75501:+ [translate_table: standard]
MVKLQFKNPTNYDVRVEANGQVQYLSPKGDRVDQCEFPEGKYQEIRVGYVDREGQQLTSPKAYRVRNDPSVDLYVWKVEDNSGWFDYDFEMSWKSFARERLEAPAHAEPNREKRERKVREGFC